jgi:uncharacterized protein (DUF4415 family)
MIGAELRPTLNVNFDCDSMKTSGTDWDKLATMVDEEIDTSDIPKLGDDFFARAELRVPEGTIPVFLTLDEEIADWFRNRSGDFRENINDALRDYTESHR